MIKAGDKIRTIGHFKGIEATVEKVMKWEEEGPPSIENHGTIYLTVTKITPNCKMNWVTIGSTEHFVYYEWQESLEIIEEKSK